MAGFASRNIPGAVARAACALAAAVCLAAVPAAAAPLRAQQARPVAETVRLARLVPASDQRDSLSCWAIAIASRFDLEAARVSGGAVKFSARYLLYFKTLADVTKLIGEGAFERTDTILCENCRRESVFYEQGGGLAETVDVALEAGLAPERAYRGFPQDDLYVFRALNRLIGDFARNPGWPRDPASVSARIKPILDAHLGRPPESFVHAGKRYTPQQFRAAMLPHLAQMQAVEIEYDPEGRRVEEIIPGANGRRYLGYLTPRRQDIVDMLAAALRAGAPVLLEYDYVARAHRGGRIGYGVNGLRRPVAGGRKSSLLGHYVLALDARFDARGGLRRVLVKNTFGLSAREGRGFHWIERDYFQHFIAVEAPDAMLDGFRKSGVLAQPQAHVSASRSGR